MSSEGDAWIVPIIAPLAAECKGMTQEAFEQLPTKERTEVVCKCLGIGDVLGGYYLRTSSTGLAAWDWTLENDSERLGIDRDDLEDEWDGALEATLKDLVVSSKADPLHCLVTIPDICSENPYFAIGISPNGNMVGYCSSLVWT